MRYSMLKYYSFAMGILVLLWCSAGHAAEFSLETNLGSSYETNVFREPIDVDDIFFTLAPKAVLKMPMNKVYSSLGLRGVIEQHVKEDKANLQEVVLSGLGRYDRSELTSFSLRDEIIVSGRLRSNDKFSDRIKKREFTDNRFAAGLQRDFRSGDVMTSLGYTNSIRDYKHTNNDDWLGHAGQLQVKYRLGYKTSVALGFGMSKKSYESGDNYTGFSVVSSLERKLSNRFRTALSLGMEGREYNDEDLGSFSWRTPSASLSIIGRLAHKTTSALVLQHRVFDSDMFTGDAFESTAADLSLTLGLVDATQLKIEGLYSRNKYRKATRSDDFLAGYAGLRYEFTWGVMTARYGYERRDSDNVFDYQQHTFELYYLLMFPSP